MVIDVSSHYDSLIDENNDPVFDPEPLKHYMDSWNGQLFIDLLNLNKRKSVLEIGVGTGRLAIRSAPLRGKFLRRVDEKQKIGNDFLQRRFSPGQFSSRSNGRRRGLNKGTIEKHIKFNHRSALAF